MALLTDDGEILMLEALLAHIAAETLTLYVELTTTIPTGASAGTAAAGVPRAAIVLERTSDAVLNDALISFGNATVTETYKGINLWDSLTGGTRYMGGALAADVAGVSGQPTQILAGAFSYSPDAG